MIPKLAKDERDKVDVIRNIRRMEKILTKDRWQQNPPMWIRGRRAKHVGIMEAAFIAVKPRKGEFDLQFHFLENALWKAARNLGHKMHAHTGCGGSPIIGLAGVNDQKTTKHSDILKILTAAKQITGGF